MKNFILIFIVSPVLLGIFSFLYITSTPQYSLYQMHKAIISHDYNEFTKFADVEEIANKAIDRFIENLIEKNNESSQSPKLGIYLTKSVLLSSKPRLREEMKAKFKKSVEEGKLKWPNYKSDNILEALVSLSVQIKNNKAEVSGLLKNDKPFIIMMKKMNGHWQIFDAELEPQI